MKELFVNNFSKALLEEKGYNIAKTPFIHFIISDYTLAKDEWGALNLINFIDYGYHNLSNIQNISDIFQNELEFFKDKVNNTPIIYFKIILAEHELSQDFIDSVLDCYTHSLIKKNTIIPIIVDLKNKKIHSNPKSNNHNKYILNKLHDILGDFSENNIFYNIEEIDYKAKKSKTIEAGNDSSKEHKPYVTYTLLLINIILFIIMELSGGSQNPYVLRYFGIKINSLIASGQYWRLLTSAFIHIGYAHIAFNMYGLYNIGTLSENMFGSRKYLFIYLLSALWGSISSFLLSPIPSAGASGALFGLFGTLLYIGQKKPRLFLTSFGINILVVLGFNLLYGFSSSGIDNYAHVGGLIGGFLASNAVGYKYEKKHDVIRVIMLMICIVLPLTVLIWVLK